MTVHVLFTISIGVITLHDYLTSSALQRKSAVTTQKTDIEKNAFKVFTIASRTCGEISGNAFM